MEPLIFWVQKKKTDPLQIFEKALDNVKPVVEVKSRRVGGANYQVPVEVRPSRRTALAMRWLRDLLEKDLKNLCWIGCQLNY